MTVFWNDMRSLVKLWPYLKQDTKLLTWAFFLIPIMTLLQMFAPICIARAIDLGVSQNNLNNLSLYSFLFLLIVVLNYLSRSSQALLTSISVHRMIRRTRTQLITHIMNLPMKTHDQSISGALVTRTTSDFDNLSEALNQGVLTSIIDIAVLVGSIVGIFLLQPQLALVVLITLPIMMVVITKFSAALKIVTGTVRTKVAKLNGFMNEGIYGSNTIKTLNAQKDIQGKFEVLNEDARAAQIKSVVLDATMYSVMDGITAITIGLSLLFSLEHWFGVTGITAGIMVAFVQALQSIFEPLTSLGSKMAMLQGAFTSIDRIFKIFSQPIEDQGHESMDPRKVQELGIKIRHLNFSYQDNKQTSTLQNIELKIPPRTSIALVGATGSGKSTIIKILAKLYSGYEGSILFGNQELSKISTSEIRKHISVVSQDAMLFAGTIRTNLTLGLSEALSDEVIWDALEVVAARNFVNEMPEKLDFELSEQGNNLSFGQRQLLCFARAVLRNPLLLILDEATSSVDPESEAMIQKAIPQLLHNRTSLVVAHRLSTIEQCDNILVLSGGRIVEQGTYEELLKISDGYFVKMKNAT